MPNKNKYLNKLWFNYKFLKRQNHENNEGLRKCSQLEDTKKKLQLIEIVWSWIGAQTRGKKTPINDIISTLGKFEYEWWVRYQY